MSCPLLPKTFHMYALFMYGMYQVSISVVLLMEGHKWKTIWCMCYLTKALFNLLVQVSRGLMLSWCGSDCPGVSEHTYTQVDGSSYQ